MNIEETVNEIKKYLPFCEPFLFVDRITYINENEISGNHKFLKNETFYKGHFHDNPLTPGVLLLETMVQIGLVCFGIYLLDIHKTKKTFLPFLSHAESDFLEPVYPGEKVTVQSKKIYFRNNILSCKIKMLNSENKVVATSISTCFFKLITE